MSTLCKKRKKNTRIVCFSVRTASDIYDIRQCHRTSSLLAHKKMFVDIFRHSIFINTQPWLPNDIERQWSRLLQGSSSCTTMSHFLGSFTTSWNTLRPAASTGLSHGPQPGLDSKYTTPTPSINTSCLSISTKPNIRAFSVSSIYGAFTVPRPVLKKDRTLTPASSEACRSCAKRWSGLKSRESTPRGVAWHQALHLQSPFHPHPPSRPWCRARQRRFRMCIPHCVRFNEHS